MCEVKINIVSKDPFEKNDRKKLNFGHTFGHAVEGFYLNSDKPISHGLAVALGMLVEAQVSVQMDLLKEEEFQEIYRVICDIYDMPMLDENELDVVLGLLSNDKKNRAGEIRTCLLKGIGDCIYDQTIDKDQFRIAYLRIRSDS